LTAPGTHGLSREARNLHWLLANLVEEVPGLLSVAVVSSDGLLLLSSDPETNGHSTAGAPSVQGAAGAGTGHGTAGPGTARPAGGPGDGPATLQDGPRGSVADLATIVSGLGSLTFGAAKLMNGGKVKQTVVAMREGNLCVMAISDGSLLGVHATPEVDMSIVAYHMAFFVSRAGHVLTPELRSELRQSMENEAKGQTTRGAGRLPVREDRGGQAAPPVERGRMAGGPTGSAQ
jgi:predicted regulator of Ras-like GTPase activity (Roadblock/LC7/MglB family)